MAVAHPREDGPISVMKREREREREREGFDSQKDNNSERSKGSIRPLGNRGV